MTEIDKETQTAIESKVFRRLLEHLDARKDVQNIDLMLLAGFCRNCLSKWYVAAAQELGEKVELESARERVYGMPYGDWKSKHQQPVSEEKQKAFEKAHRS